MKRINYFVSLIMVLAVVLFASITGVSAASSLPSSVTTDAIREVEYIKNFPVIVKTANNGKYELYCMNIEATYAGGVKFSAKGSVADGYLYILNAKPNTGNKDKDFYIKQMAVWYYEDYLSNDNNNLDKVVKQYILSHKDSEEVSKKIYQLFQGAQSYKQTAGTLSITKPSSLTWTKKDGYYVSQDIKVNSSNLSEAVTYGLSNAPVGTKVVKGTAANTVQVKVPVDKVPEGKKLTLTLKVSGKYNKQIAYYYYNSAAYQKLLFQDAYDQAKTISASLDMTLIPEQKHEVLISKVDASTNASLAGAKLAVYNSANTLVEEWTSTTSDHKMYLYAGTYTLKETKAPDKYVLNTTPVKFVVDATGNVTVGGTKVSKVVLKNTKICYKAEFVMHGHGTQVPAQTCIVDGGKVVKPADPTETGWKFEGWYIDANYTKPYDFNTAVHENKVIHAKWTPVYKAEFVMHGHGAQVPTQYNIPDGGKVVKPENPTEKGWKFEGWYVDANYTKLYDFNTAVHENKVIHAKWTPIVYKVEFVMHGHGEQVPTQNNIPDGGKATDPNQQNVGEWIFEGWFEEYNEATGEYSKPYDFNTLIHEDKVLHAKWTKKDPDKYNVNISKTDVTKTKEIAGATLELYDENGTRIASWVSTTTAHTVSLLPGKYSLKETIAPKGYKLTSTTIYFMVDSTGVLYEKTTAGTYTKVAKINMINELLDVVSIIKRDKANDKILSDAVLVIRDAKGDVVKEFTTTTKASTFDLDAGEYSLIEKAAPNGYVKSEEVIYFRLLDDGTLQVKNSKGEYVDSTVVTFYNEKKKEEPVPVPKTDLDSTIYVMSGIVLLAGGVYFANKTIKEY